MTIDKQVKQAWFELGKAEAQAEIDELKSTIEGMAEINLDDQQVHAKEVEKQQAEIERLNQWAIDYHNAMHKAWLSKHRGK